MAKADASIGKGTKVKIGETFVGQMTNISIGGGEVQAIDVTHFDSDEPQTPNQIGGMEYAFTRCGAPPVLSCDLIWNPGQLLPLPGDENLVTITFPLKKGYRTQGIWAGQGAITNPGPIEGGTNTAYTQKLTIQGSGVWEWTPPQKVV